MIERNFNLHLTAGHSTALVINANQFDQGEKWIFTLYNENGTQYIPSTGAIVGIKSDGLGIINSGSVVDGKVVIMETEQMTAAVGKAVFELMIDSQTHGTANFIVLVEPKPGNNADLSESDLSLLQEAIDATSPLPTGGTVGQVLTKTANGSAWSDAGTPTQEQVADAVSDWADEHITVETGVVIDTSLSVAGAAADAKKTGDEISDLKSAIQSGGVPHEVKLAMDTLFAKMGVKDDAGYASTYAVIHEWATAVNLLSISAVFDQGDNIILDIDDLEVLRQYLTVTATYDDGTSAEISSYTLSGTLTEGTSYVTVTEDDKTTSFAVTVTGTTDVVPALSAWVASRYVTLTPDSINNTLGIVTTQNKTYQGATAPFTTEAGYSYRFEADANISSGLARCGFSAGEQAFKNSGTITTSGHVSVEIDADNTVTGARLYITYSTAMGANVTFSNMHIYKYVKGA